MLAWGCVIRLKSHSEFHGHVEIWHEVSEILHSETNHYTTRAGVSIEEN